MKIDCLSKRFLSNCLGQANTLIFDVEIEEIMILSCLKSKVLSMV